MSQMCPVCSFDNLDDATNCTQCSSALRGLLGEKTQLSERYQLVSVLGCGAMGAVYLGEDQRLVGRRCAIKENRLDPAATPDAQAQAREQFLAEASVLARLDHPGLPKVSDYFIENGREYLVMDYVEGEDLESRILRSKAPMEEALVLSWADQVLDALGYLHNQRPQPIIHRDIKPANLRLNVHNRVRLVDFGLVKLLDSSNPETKVEMRGMGTPAYAPLEQFAGSDAHTDARSDIYALGATIYHLLTHIFPKDVHERLLNPKVLTPPRELNANLSEKTEQVILKAMEVHPDQRYQSAAEMHQAISEANQALVAAPATSQPAAAAASGRSFSPVLFGVLAVIFLLVVGISAFILFSGGSGGGNVAAATPQQPAAIVETQPTATATEELKLIGDAPTAEPGVEASATTPLDMPTPLLEETPTETPSPSPSPEATATPEATSPASVSPSQGIPTSSLTGIIAYPVFNGEDYDLYFGQVDGSGTELFQKGASQPAFSPDGERIALHSWRLDARGLINLNLSESTDVLLIAPFVEDQLPTWSADGNHIIFLSRREGDRKSRLIRVGSQQERSNGLVLGEGEYPSIGATGQLLFKGWGQTGAGLRLSSITFEGVQGITDRNEDTAPALSPDGKQVAFMSRRAGNWEIYRSNVDGSDLQRLTDDFAEDGLPTWSPDGKVIAFVSSRGGSWAIWAMLSDGSGLQKLFNIEGSPDGFVSANQDESRGWAEERISWKP